MEEERRWYVGIDWASVDHVVRVSDAHGTKIGERSFKHGGEGLNALASWILEVTKAPPAAVHIAIEVPHGPIVESLMEHGFNVYAINPKQLDRFRDRFSPAGAKDDSRDACVLCDAIRTDPRCFRTLLSLDPVLVELREWSRIAEELRHDRNRLSNRVRELLWRYYPQLLELTEDAGAPWFLALWRLVPTPAKAKRVREATIAKLLKRYRIRRITAGQILEKLQVTAIPVAPGTINAATGHLEAIAMRLDLVNRQIINADARIDHLTGQLAASESTDAGQQNEQRDVTILRSLPGVGRIVLATLLAEASDALHRRDYHALRCLSGVAPITKRSGKSRIVIMRQAVHVRLRNGVYHWARVAIQHDPRSRAKYAALRARGHGHGRALRSVADRLLAVACKMLLNQTSFDPALASKTI